MKLHSVNVTDFKAFHDLELDFGGRSTVIAGINGVGKSTVLSAIAYLMHIWLKRLNPSQGKAFETIPPKPSRWEPTVWCSNATWRWPASTTP